MPSTSKAACHSRGQHSLKGLLFFLLTASSLIVHQPPAASAALQIPYVPHMVRDFPQKMIKFCSDAENELLCRRLHDDAPALSTDEIDLLRELWKGSEERLLFRPGAGRLLRPETTFSRLDASAREMTVEKGSTLEERLIEGMTDFAITRAKAEAALYMREELTQKMCNKREKRKYFKNTCIAFDASMDIAISLHGMGTYLRNAIRRDLENLPDIMLQEAEARSSGADRDALTSARILLAAYLESREGRPSLELMSGISEIEALKCTEDKGECRRFIDTLRTASLIIRSLESTAEAPGIAERDPMYERYRLMGAYFAFEAMVLAPGENAVTRDKDRIRQKAAPLMTHYLALEHLKERLLHVRKITDAIRQPVKVAEDGFSYDPRHRLYERLAAMDRAVNLLEEAAHGAIEIREIVNGIDAYEEKILFDDGMGKVRYVFDTGRQLLRGDSAALMVTTIDMASRFDETLLPEEIKSYLPVFTEIANTRSTREVSNILEAASAPVASYRQKKIRRLTTLNAFVGFHAWGKEVYETDTTREEYSYSGNLFAPLGVHKTWPLWKGKDYLHNMGIFISIIDLGPMVNSREQDNIDSQPNTGFKQLLSPGVFATMGLLGPMTLGGGWSITPEILRAKTGEDVSAYRWQIFLALDLTLLPF